MLTEREQEIIQKAEQIKNREEKGKEYNWNIEKIARQELREINHELNNKIQSDFIKIPNVVMNNRKITNNAKVLYGYILNKIYYGEFTKTIEEISFVLNVSINTTRKTIKELEKEKYIDVQNKGNKRIITPLINDSMIIEMKQDINRKRKIENMQEMEKRNKVLTELIKNIK